MSGRISCEVTKVKAVQSYCRVELQQSTNCLLLNIYFTRRPLFDLFVFQICQIVPEYR